MATVDQIVRAVETVAAGGSAFPDRRPTGRQRCASRPDPARARDPGPRRRGPRERRDRRAARPPGQDRREPAAAAVRSVRRREPDRPRPPGRAPGLDRGGPLAVAAARLVGVARLRFPDPDRSPLARLRPSLDGPARDRRTSSSTTSSTSSSAGSGSGRRSRTSPRWRIEGPFRWITAIGVRRSVRHARRDFAGSPHGGVRIDFKEPRAVGIPARPGDLRRRRRPRGPGRRAGPARDRRDRRAGARRPVAAIDVGLDRADERGQSLPFPLDSAALHRGRALTNGSRTIRDARRRPPPTTGPRRGRRRGTSAACRRSWR